MRILTFILSLLSMTTFGQIKVTDFDRMFFVGELTNLHDTIEVYQKFEQLKAGQNYTQLKKIKRNNYEIWYWLMELGGIVDPAIYKKPLKMTEGNGIVQIKYLRRTKEYRVVVEQTVLGKRYLLLKK